MLFCFCLVGQPIASVQPLSIVFRSARQILSVELWYLGAVMQKLVFKCFKILHIGCLMEWPYQLFLAANTTLHSRVCRWVVTSCPLSSGGIQPTSVICWGRVFFPGSDISDLLFFQCPFQQNKAVHLLRCFADNLPSICPSDLGWNGPFELIH